MALFLALIASAPLLLNSGFLNTRGGGDSPFLLFRLHQMVTALSEGVFPVRWMPDAAFGLGYPFFNYYASLPYYFASIFKLLGLSYVLSLKLTQIGGFLLAGWGMYRWVEHSTQRRSGALLASAAYSFAPYHMVNVYVRGDSLVEFWAMAWFPLILLSIREAALNPTRRQIALVALSYGALVMTHNVSALIFSPVVAGYALVMWWANSSFRTSSLEQAPPSDKPRWRRLVVLAGAGVLGLVLAAWVWLPALGEQSYAQLGDQTTGFFFYGNHFRSGDLVQPTLAFNYDTGTEGSSPFSMGLAQAVLIVVGVMMLVARGVQRSQIAYRATVLLGLIVATLMITPASAILWEKVPLLSFTQFPWRFLSIQALFGAAAIGMIAETAERQSERSGWIAAGATTLIIGGAALIGLKPNFIPITDADVTAERLQWYEAFSGNIGTTIRYEYLPRWTHPRPYTSDFLLGQEARAKFMSGAGEAERLSAGAASQVWEIRVEDGSAEVALPILYWPGWKAQSDDQSTRLEITPLEGLGYIKLQVPEGDHTIRLWLGRTPIRAGAEIASLVGMVILIVLWRPRVPHMDDMGWALVGGGILTVVVVAMIARDLPRAVSNRETLSADFGQNAYFYSERDGIPFSDGRRLQAIEVKPEDRPVGVALRWLETPDQPPIILLTAGPQQDAQGAAFYPASTFVSGMTPGLYFVEIDRDGIFALTENGLQRGILYGAPVLVPTGLRDRPVTQFEAIPFDPANLIDTATETRIDGLLVRLWWETLSEFSLNTSTALRWIDVNGNEWGALDTITGSAGLYSTGLWQPGEIVPDTYMMSLPPGTPPGDYRLRVTMYDATSLAVLGAADIEVSGTYTTQTRCDDFIPLNEEAFGFRDVQLPDQGNASSSLEFSIDWVSCQPITDVLQARWILDNGTESFAIESDLAPGSDPQEWTVQAGRAALVTGRQRLELPAEITAGMYDLSVQLITDSGEAVGETEFLGVVDITGQARMFEVPDLDHEVIVNFGDQIALRGYSIVQTDDELKLDVAWEALDDLSTDYKFFVHVLDVESETIVAQIDSMPRAYAYPTSLWVDGEIVDDQLILVISDVPAGDYRIAIGWYVEGGGRLPLDDGGDRYFVDEPVVIP